MARTRYGGVTLIAEPRDAETYTVTLLRGGRIVGPTALGLPQYADDFDDGPKPRGSMTAKRLKGLKEALRDSAALEVGEHRSGLYGYWNNREGK
jgi:hypothetical protein